MPLSEKKVQAKDTFQTALPSVNPDDVSYFPTQKPFWTVEREEYNEILVDGQGLSSAESTCENND